MMTVFKTFINLPAALFTVATVGLLSGCTTTQSLQPCSTQEAARLNAHIAPTKARLDRNQNQLSRIRVDLEKERCNGSLFSPASKSPQCERLKTQEQKLVSDSKTLSERLAEINAAIAGRPHAGHHVKSCSASWLPKRSTQKSAPARKLVKAPVKASAKPATKAPHTAGLPVEDYVVPAYSSYRSSTPEPVAYTPSHQPVSLAPKYIAPVAATPPVERVYSDSAKVRVIGSSFFPDQSKPVGPQVPDHAPAP